MAIDMNGVVLQEASSRLTTRGRIIQTVHKTTASGVATSSTSPVFLFDSDPITLTNASNKIIIDLYSENRSNDWGDAVWNLHYMRIDHIQSGGQIQFSSFNGEFTFTIRPYTTVAIHTPGSVGPHSYRVYGWSYQASSTTFITGAGGDNVASIRLSEVAVS